MASVEAGILSKDSSSAKLPMALEEDDLICESGALPAPWRFHAKSNYGLISGSRRSWRQVMAAVGVAGLVAWAVVAVVSHGLKHSANAGQGEEASQEHEVAAGHPAYHCVFTPGSTCPARLLFANPEIHEVVTENMMQVGQGIVVHADRDTIRSAVSSGFRNISGQLEQRSPEIADELDMVEFTEDQKNAVLSWMRLMGMPKVQRVGYEVATAIRQSLAIERRTVEKYVEKALEANIMDIKEKRDELVSVQLRMLWGAEHRWALTLDPENLRVMESFHGGSFFGSDIYAPTRHLTHEEMVQTVHAGILEQGRALLDIIKLRARALGWHSEIPPWPTSLAANVVDAPPHLLSCELDKDKDGLANFMKAMFCPLKFGIQGMDALRAVEDLLSKESAKNQRMPWSDDPFQGGAENVLGEDTLLPATIKVTR